MLPIIVHPSKLMLRLQLSGPRFNSMHHEQTEAEVPELEKIKYSIHVDQTHNHAQPGPQPLSISWHLVPTLLGR